jgi:hypothetical protein
MARSSARAFCGRTVSALGLLVAAAVPAMAAGPDITHQEIQDVSNYGQVGGIYGYAWGSYTCNLGDTSLSWINAGTPALGMNAYRLADGRLVQIGLGFAKHACCVGNGTGCGTCIATGGAGLRPGCRDIYSSGFNGGQTRLGPRSGIDPYQGTFTAIPTFSGTAISRRVQVNTGDMSAATYPNAIYFAEGVYVCAEEEPAQQLNNATYRRMSVANTGAAPTYNWAVAAGGATVSGQPAIYGWREHGNGANAPDTSVVIVTADVPAEGRFFVAGKVKDLSGAGTGPWQYEYAVYNLNSHRSGGSFVVPIPSSASVTNVGFSSPDYHSGEIYDNTDWTGGKSSGAVRWNSPATFDVNPNTNALRWGTMYNFWFTADVAPAATLGSVTLGLFRPGTPMEISVSGLPVPPAPPPCAADFNANGSVTVQDVYDFLGAYFSGNASADINHVGGLSVQDIFDFLSGYFAGC